MRRRVITAIAVWALAIGQLAACSKSNGTPSTTTTTATTITTATPSGSTAKAYTKADLDAVLLTLADMPAGYALNPLAGPEYTVMSSCADEAIALDGYQTGALAKTGTSYNTTSGQLVVQSLTLLSGDIADNTLAALRKAVARCTTWTIEKSTYTMAKADYGPYGDESLSYRVNAQSEGPFVLDIVFVRKANLLVGVMVAGQGTGTPKDAQAVFDAVARRLAKQ